MRHRGVGIQNHAVGTGSKCSRLGLVQATFKVGCRLLRHPTGLREGVAVVLEVHLWS